MSAPAETVRGGLDSLLWLLNNAHNHDTDKWSGYVAAARDDRAKALAALATLEADLARLREVQALLDEPISATSFRRRVRAALKEPKQMWQQAHGAESA